MHMQNPEADLQPFFHSLLFFFFSFFSFSGKIWCWRLWWAMFVLWFFGNRQTRVRFWKPGGLIAGWKVQWKFKIFGFGSLKNRNDGRFSVTAVRPADPVRVSKPLYSTIKLVLINLSIINVQVFMPKVDMAVVAVVDCTESWQFCWAGMEASYKN